MTQEKHIDFPKLPTYDSISCGVKFYSESQMRNYVAADRAQRQAGPTLTEKEAFDAWFNPYDAKNFHDCWAAACQYRAQRQADTAVINGLYGISCVNLHVSVSS